MAKTIALVKQLRLYPLAKAASPPDQRFIDIAGKPFDGIVSYDESFFVRLARMLSEEAVQQRDLVMMGQLRSPGSPSSGPALLIVTALRSMRSPQPCRLRQSRLYQDGVRSF